MSIIKLQDIWEKFRIKFIRDGAVTWKEFYALEAINFDINTPGVLGIIGHNGAGKTTLLKIIAGMLMPDKGVINVNGRISMLMELGAGFNPEFTGRENILLNARMYGVDESSLNQQIGKIVEFADLGEFIDAPIKYYSQGMHMRLAFALAIFVEPDILLIDDILAVGDEEARQKCIKKIFELKDLGKIIILVSHDMEMVSKLCDRVMLLDKGKIIKDDFPGPVIQYYMDMVGDKKGIAILKEGDLKVVFNNGRINILWKDNIITRQQGGYIAYFSNKINNWLLSFNLSWQINELSSNSIIAQARDVNNNCSQAWRIRLEAGELTWKVEISEPETKDEHIDLFFIVDYKNWQTLEKEEAFPPFIYKSNWQDLKIDNSISEGLIAFRPEKESTDLSGVILEVEKGQGSFKVFNTGYDQEARVIQAYFNDPRAICFRLKLFPEESSLKVYLEARIKQFLIKKLKQLLLEQKLKEEQLILEQKLKEEQLILEQKFKEEQLLLEQRIREEEEKRRSLPLGDLRVYVDLEIKSIKLFFKDKEITRGKGLHSAIFAQKKWFFAQEGQWQVKKISMKELELNITYDALPMTQTWSFVFSKKNILNVKIKMQVDKALTLRHQSIILELVDIFDGWQTANEKGDFSSLIYVNDLAPVRLKDNKLSEAILTSSHLNNFKLLFGVACDSRKQIKGIYKRKFGQVENIYMSSELIFPKNEETVNPGTHILFSGQIALDTDIKLKKSDVSYSKVELVQDKLRFVFDEGKGKLFWGKKELTTGLGIFSSIRFSGIWFDSYQASWNIDKLDKGQVIITGTWPYIPILQKWTVKIINENSLSWEIEMENLERIHIEFEQACIMLSPEFRDWSVEGVNSGKFLDEFTKDYDISPFRFWYGPSVLAGIRAENDGITVLFNSSMNEKSLKGIIENTDYLYSARLLQYQRANTQKPPVGKSKYFKGLIKVDPSKQLR